jgi:Protein of unknown function (DUF998)
MITTMTFTTTASHSRAQETTRWLTLGAVAGPALFTLAFIVLGLLRPGYSSVSEQVSTLAIGPNGGLMRAAFLLDGLLVTVGVVAVFLGLRHDLGAVARWACTVLLALSPLGILWAGIFTRDHLALHTLGVVVGLGTPVITFLVVGLVLRRVPSWRRLGTLMLLACPLTVALLVGFTNSVPPSVMRAGGAGGSLGLWQRAMGIEVQAWFVAMGWLAFRRTQRSATPEPTHTSQI